MDLNEAQQQRKSEDRAEGHKSVSTHIDREDSETHGRGEVAEAGD